MNETEARTFREAANAAVTRYSKMPTAKLQDELTQLHEANGMQRIFGTSSRDELIREVLDLRGYTVTKLNEATHVLYHDPRWPDCPFCLAELADPATYELAEFAAGRNGESVRTDPQ